jgi:hypothetical protein
VDFFFMSGFHKLNGCGFGSPISLKGDCDARQNAKTVSTLL